MSLKNPNGRDLVRIWLVLAVAYASLKFAFNLIAFGWIDLRPASFVEMFVVPLGQALVLLAVMRR